MNKSISIFQHVLYPFNNEKKNKASEEERKSSLGYCELQGYIIELVEIILD